MYTKIFSCGCKILASTQGSAIIASDIHMCPKHKAAPDMYEALLSALGVMATLDQNGGWVKEIKQHFTNILHKAEGK